MKLTKRFSSAVLMLFVTLFSFALSEFGYAKENSKYQSASLVTWSVENVKRSRYAGEPFGDVYFGTQVTYLAPLYHLTVDFQEWRYELYYTVKSRGNYIPKLSDGESLQVYIEEKSPRMRIRMPDGKTFKAEIVSKTKVLSTYHGGT